MQYPVRPDACCGNHFDCFDLMNYLEASKHVTRWRCPICNNPLSVLNLMKCELTEKLILYINYQYPLESDQNATIEKQRKEVEYAYFDITIFGKLLVFNSVSEIEQT